MIQRENVIKLSDSVVERLVCPHGKKQFIYWDEGTKGFGVRVTENGTKSYLVQLRVKGSKQERQIKIEPQSSRHLKFKEASLIANEIILQMKKGIDPVIEAKRVREEKAKQAIQDIAVTVTLREVMEHYLTHRRTSKGTPLREASQRDIRRHVNFNLSDWADQPIANITRDTCLAKFTEISERAPAQANQCMVNLRALCNHARELYADESGNYKIFATNPVQRMFKIRKLNKETPKDGRIPLNKIGAVWKMLQARRENAYSAEDRTAADWVCFMLLTGTRRNESGSLLWADVDLKAGTFHLSENVVKNHNGITLPMSKALSDILQARKDLPAVSEKVIQRRKRNPDREQSAYVFPSWGKTGHITAAQAVMKAVEDIAGVHVSIHDLRRTFDDVGMQCGIGESERMQLLNHMPSGVHNKHYSNNPSMAALSPAVNAIGQWILNAA